MSVMVARRTGGVYVDGVLIGHVWRHHSNGGRWQATTAVGICNGLYYRRRADAIAALIEHHRHQGQP